ncbi:type VII secretion protein EsaA [Streptococcus sp. OMI870]|uniref:type VII secretion protein EsaA n=1 Tax=Streptococcus sp. OMI870 TaxID=3047018 RepID=UPI0039C324D7
MEVKKKKWLKYIGQSAVVLLLMGSVVGLYTSVQKDQKQNEAKTVQTTENTKLNIAVVNEDKAVKLNDKEYNLGASYVKNIERDNSQNWSVLPRGAAESGLADGKYQLMIVIPSDFSEKVLEVNAVNAEKTTVTYKVNAAGNSQVENEANKVAKDIVSDLNSQLVDMYMVSILSNLYTAQKNVETSNKIQSTNIGSYRTNLLNSALESKNIFPSLYGLSTSSVESNNALKTLLESYTQAFDQLSQSQDQYGQNFDLLIKQRSADKISHEEFMSQLMAMNQSVVSEKTQDLYKRLQQNQEAITKQLSQPAEGEADPSATKTYAGLTKDVNDRIAELEKGIQAERDKLDEHEKNIEASVKSKVLDYYGLNEGDKVTLRTLLGKTSIKTLSDARNKADDNIRNAIKKLPSLDPASLNLNKYGNLNTAIHFDSTFAGTMAEANGNADELKTLAAEVDAKLTAVADVLNARSGKQKVSILVPAGVKVDTWTYDGHTYAGGGEQEVELQDGKQIQIHLAEDGGTMPSTIDVEVLVNGVSSTSVTVSAEDLKTAVANYATKASEIALNYQRAGALIDAYYPEDDKGDRHSLYDPIENMDLTEALADIVKSTVASNIKDYRTSIETDEKGDATNSVKAKLDDTLKQLQVLGPELQANLTAIENTNKDLTQNINDQLTQYAELQKQLEDISKTQETVTEAQIKTDADLSALGSEYTSLLSSTESVKSSSRSNVDAANSTNEIFNQLNKELERAQGNTEKLSSDAESLMGDFDKELSENGNFVEAFRKVFNNAYENGVPNEVLLDFLSNPVAEKSSSVKATINVYRPFIWIFMLEVLSLFTAYLFATQPIIRKVKNRFKLNRLQESDILSVGVLVGLSLILGLVIGMISSIQLSVGREYVPSWVFLAVLASFVLVQLQYLLLKHFRVLGMGLAFFMLISYVYLSSAIGTTATLSGLPAHVKNVNLLSILEGQFAGYFDGQTAGIGHIFGLLVFFGLLALANTFIPKKFTQTKEIESSL